MDLEFKDFDTLSRKQLLAYMPPNRFRPVFVQYLRKKLAEQPDDHALRIRLSVVLEKSGGLQEAMQQARMVPADSNEAGRALHRAGMVFKNQEMHESARDEFRAAFEHMLAHAVADESLIAAIMMQLVLSEFKLGNAEQTGEYISMWLKKHPHDTNACLGYLQALTSLEESVPLPRALEERLASDTPDDEAIHRAAYVYYQRIDNKEGMKRHVSRLKEYKPDVDTMIPRILMLKRYGALIEATELAEKLCTDFPENLDASMALAAVYTSAGDHTRRLAVMARAADKHPNDTHALKGLGYAYLDNGMYKGALHICDLLAKIPGAEDNHVLRLKAVALARSGRKTESAAIFKSLEDKKKQRQAEKLQQEDGWNEEDFNRRHPGYSPEPALAEILSVLKNNETHVPTPE